jgi:hypothetical protein
MDNLSNIAIQNLVFLSQKDKFLANQYKLVNKEFITSEGDTFDTIYSFSDLEYPIYFTFHQVMNHMHGSYENNICGYTRKELIYLMNVSVDNLLEYYGHIEECNSSFEELLDDLDEKVFLVKGYYKYGWCLWLPTKIKEYLNWACVVAVGASKEIVKDYIQEMKDPGGYSDEDSDEDSDDSNDLDYSTEENESNDSSEDIPDLDETEHSKED